MELFETIRATLSSIVIFIIAIAFLVKVEKDKEIFNLIIIIIFIRILFSFVWYWLGLPPDLPDVNFYEYEINLLIRNGMDLGVINSRFDVHNYIIFQSLFRILLGNIWMITVLINSLLGTFAIYNSSKIAYEVSGKKARILTIIFLSCEPTIFLYTNTHLRESIVFYTITLAILNIVRYMKNRSNKYILKFLIVTLISGLFRSVNLFVLISMGGVGVLIAKKKKEIDIKKVTTLFLIMLSAITVLNILQDVLNFSLDIKYINENLNRDLLGGGTMPYLVGERYESWMHLITSIPKRLVYFLLHPFPWLLGNIKYTIPFASSVYNLIFIVAIIIGMFILNKRRIGDKKLIVSVIFILIVGLIIYAVAKSESASRHRLQFIWLFPVIYSSIYESIIKNKGFQ